MALVLLFVQILTEAAPSAAYGIGSAVYMLSSFMKSTATYSVGQDSKDLTQAELRPPSGDCKLLQDSNFQSLFAENWLVKAGALKTR